ncbi:hypothetical protein GR138_12070 [Shinella kummerowiae]|uniref:Tip attachment protein J domain-containing protein n=2 Tax=Shinella kummerowiae TaxID=417745 RepID=A0A6N8SGP9_9HYPH|nr:hypothetical protein [Shinella kummerowiae]
MHSGGYERMSSEDIERRVAEMDGYRTFMRSTTSHYDPIFTPLFTAIGFSTVGIAGTSISAVSIASAIATTALSIGLQYLLAPKPPKPDDGKQPMTQAIPYRHWVVGRRRVSGAYMLWDSKGKYLYAVQAIAGHKISSINRYWLHDDEVTLDVDSNVEALADGRYKSNMVQVYSRLGLPTETAYAPLVEALAADDVWTENHRGDGQASIALVAKTPVAKYYTERFPYGAPRLSVEVDGAFVWDYRIDEDPSNPAAWVFSRNAALIMAWHQCFNEFGHKRDYAKAILPVIDMWKAEADVCDEDVPLSGGGTEKRYLCDGFATAENDPKVGTNAILAACDGWICERGDGALLFVVGKFREEYCTTLRDRDITGYQLQHDVLFKDECNRLVPKFTYPATDYTTSDTDFFEDTDAQLLSGRVLAQEADYGWCTQWRQARRLGIRDWRRFQQKKKGTLDVRLCGINAVYSRWIRMETPLGLPSLHDAIIENRRSVLALTKGGYTMDFIQHPENIDDWTPATDEGAAPPVPPKPTIAGIPTPEIDTIEVVPKSGVVFLRISIPVPDGDEDEVDDKSLAVRYRLKDAGLGVPGEWVEQIFHEPEIVADVMIVSTAPVPSDELLEVEAAYISAKGKYGLWSITEEIFTTSDPVAPSALTVFTQTAAAPHLGHAVFSLTTANDAHLKTVKLYRKATGVALNIAVDTPLATLTVASSIAATYGYTDGDASRTNIISNGDFAASLTGWTAGSGWSWNAGVAKKTAGTASDLTQAVGGMAAGDVMRIAVDMSARTAGQMTISLTGTTNVNSTGKTVNGSYLERLTANASSVGFRLRGDATFDGAGDNVVVFKETGTCAPQGVWDYYAVPFNGSGVAGATSGPVTVTII